ncbi:MAG: cation:dicarboxylase symporter family transporter [Steroidobacteraceae bacterium]|nr:cation:dicarboxylase symporter family transporter [Steroidobacteraceae bacterium]
MSSTNRIILALAAGLAAGATIAATGQVGLARAVSILQPVGTLWVNALRMTVIPLVFAVLVTGVATAASAASAGRLAARTMLLFAVFLLASVAATAIVVPAIFAAWPIPESAAAALRAGALSLHQALPPVAPVKEWLTGLIPVNPVEAAAEGAVLPLIVFALFFAFALAHIAPESRDRLTGFFQAIADAMVVIVKWILWAAPLGVFALALGVGFHGGLDAAGALLYYVVLLSVLCLLATGAMYPIAAAGKALTFRQFARGAAPAQVVAASTQSSLATLPAMIGAAQESFRLPTGIVGLVLPLAVSLFRVSTAVANLAAAIFVAALYDVALSPVQLATGALVSFATSIGSVGVSSQVSYFFGVMPICLAMGLPVEVLALLLAVEVLPDIFRTICNVTADLAVTVLLGRERRAAAR